MIDKPKSCSKLIKSGTKRSSVELAMHIFHLKITIIIWDTEVHFIMFRVMPKTRLAFSKFCFENHFIDPFTPRPPLGEFIATLTFNCGRNFVVSPIKWNLFRRTFVPGLARAITDQEIMWWELVKWSPQGNLIFDQILSTNCSKKCIKIGLGNFFVDWG